MTQRRIAFIGAGNMARSLMSGLRREQPDATLIAADPSDEQRQLADALGVATSTDNAAAIANADVVVLAVKPQIAERALAGCAGAFNSNQLLISVAAGITTATLRNLAGPAPDIVRCMPNTPALLGLGMTALFAEAAVSQSKRDDAEAVLGAVGLIQWVDVEADLDAVTAVSGSGPAYFFALMEHMIAAGKELGLSEQVAQTLTVQTAIGAAAMAQQSSETIAELRQNVTSPGGTTAAALDAMAEHGLAATVRAGLAAAARRSEELSAEFAADGPAAPDHSTHKTEKTDD